MKISRPKKLLICWIMVGVLLTANSNLIVAWATSTKDKLNQVTEERKNLESELDEANGNVDQLKSEQNTLKGELKGLNAKLTEVSDRLSQLESDISDKNAEIEVTSAELDKAIDTEEWQYACMVRRVRDMYERNDTSVINSILASGSLSEVLNAADYYEKIANYDKNKLQEFKEIHNLVELQKQKLEAEKAELDELQLQAEAEKNKVSGLISSTSSNIAAYADDIEEAEIEALAVEAALKAKEQEEETLKKKLAEELAMSQLAANSTWRNISDVTFAEGDRYLLANLIYCEAGGEPYAGQVAVGSVVINRVLSSVYPDTVVGVIYQNKQFSPVGSGRLELALAANKATASCYKAADEAMSGMTNVGNCLYFRTPIDGLNGISIGGHIFY
ncbi:MAG: cell wall hydrolase [Acetatifactor sp.]|nr:cell wall hydrolase [Acetatifactor sp.]